MQLFTPGLPQIYYVDLLGGHNDLARFERTGEGRDVNRHYYPPQELDAALGTDITRAQLALVALRTQHPAFDSKSVPRVDGQHRLELTWANGRHRAALLADVTQGRPAFRLELTDVGGVSRSAGSVAELAGLVTSFGSAPERVTG